MTDKVEVSDEDGRVRITDVDIFDKMTEEEALAVFEEDESDTPAIDKVVDKFTKGGPGSGIKGHTTQKQKEVTKAKEAIKKGKEALKQAYSEMDSVGTNRIKATQLNNRIAQAQKVIDAGKKVLKEHAPKGSGKMSEKAKALFNEIKEDGDLDNAREQDVEDLQDAYRIDEKTATQLHDKIQSHSKQSEAQDLFDEIKEEGNLNDRREYDVEDLQDAYKIDKKIAKELYDKIQSVSKTPTIDALIEKGGPGSGQKGHKTSDLRRHSQYTSSDYSALKKKGYTDKEIGGIWDKDKKSGKKPLHRKEIPKMDESVKAKKISERLKSESTSKTPSIDALIANS